ncbi:MAG: lmo0937 family membrane protein [Candidatus Margulisiibacteriota bacterium]|jgi:hypothetical protein
MLESIIFILLFFWLFGMLASVTIGGLIHLLLVIAIVMTLVRIIRGRPVL